MQDKSTGPRARPTPPKLFGGLRVQGFKVWVGSCFCGFLEVSRDGKPYSPKLLGSEGMA